MKRRRFVEVTASGTMALVSVGTTGLGILSGCKTAGRSGKRPNVVYVFADQWRASAMVETVMPPK